MNGIGVRLGSKDDGSKSMLDFSSCESLTFEGHNTALLEQNVAYSTSHAINIHGTSATPDKAPARVGIDTRHAQYVSWEAVKVNGGFDDAAVKASGRVLDASRVRRRVELRCPRPLVLFQQIVPDPWFSLLLRPSASFLPVGLVFCERQVGRLTRGGFFSTPGTGMVG